MTIKIESQNATSEIVLLRTYPFVCGWNLMRQKETTVGCESLEDNRLE
jgi:hypothetical protein